MIQVGPLSDISVSGSTHQWLPWPIKNLVFSFSFYSHFNPLIVRKMGTGRLPCWLSKSLSIENLPLWYLKNCLLRKVFTACLYFCVRTVQKYDVLEGRSTKLLVLYNWSKAEQCSLVPRALPFQLFEGKALGMKLMAMRFQRQRIIIRGWKGKGWVRRCWNLRHQFNFRRFLSYELKFQLSFSCKYILQISNLSH